MRKKRGETHQVNVAIKFLANGHDEELCNIQCNSLPIFQWTLDLKVEYHAVGDTWWQPLLSYGNCIWPI